VLKFEPHKTGNYDIDHRVVSNPAGLLLNNAPRSKG
jgi:hypothetical protein